MNADFTNFEWNINSELLSKFLKAENEEMFHSNSFNLGEAKFIFEAYPNGHEVNNKGRAVQHHRKISQDEIPKLKKSGDIC